MIARLTKAVSTRLRRFSRLPALFPRMALVAALFVLTLYPLGRDETSIGYLLSYALQYFSADGKRYVFWLAIFLYVSYGLEFWRYLEAAVAVCWRTVKRHPKATVLSCMALFTGVAVWMCYTLYGLYPRIPDSVAQYVNAKMIASGTFLSPPPPLEHSFFMLCMVMNPIWISHYMPVHTLIQSLGHVVHLPWLVNPLLGAAGIGLTYLLARETHGAGVAFGALFLATLSPFLLFMSASFMNHASGMVMSAAFYLFFVRTAKYYRQSDAILAGAFLGLIFLTRVYTAFLIAVPSAAMVLYWLYRDPQHRQKIWEAFWPCGQTCALFLLLVLGFNALTTGDPLTFTSQLTHGSQRAIGFGEVPEIMQPFVGATEHTPWRGVLYASNNLLGLNYFLWRWPVPSLLPVALLFLLRTRNAWNRRLLAFAVVMVAGHMLHFFQDWCFGPRFIYESAPVLIVLAAAGLARVPVILRAVGGWRMRPATLRAGMAICVVVASYHAVQTGMPKRNFDGCTVPFRSAYQLALAKGLDHALIIVSDGDYVTAAVANPPSEAAPLIVIRDLGEELNQKAMDYYPTRDVYRITATRDFTLIRKGQPE